MSPSRFSILTRSTALGAILALAPAAAMAQATGAGQGPQQQQQMNQGQPQGQTQSQAPGEDQEGDEIKLTRQEADQWKMRPVMNEDDQQVGQVTALVLDDDGEISELHFETGQALGLGSKTVKVEADEFTANAQRVKLEMSNEEIQELPSAGTAQ